ncbi:MAG: peptide chain release factor 1 [Desulfohalobiaceae bacterium]|nr:peptide chain release factor 1 [Desulfohalobiaceae bacterium]
MSFLSKLEDIEQRFLDIEQQLGSPEVVQDQRQYSELAKTHAELSDIVNDFREYKEVLQALEKNKDMLRDEDPGIRELAKTEQEELENRSARLEQQLKLKLVPEDPMDKKAVILEIRAGTGGDEAALFVADLLKMYMRYAEGKGWSTQLLNKQDSGAGGFKEVVGQISGKRVYSRLKYESGVHRVQRVPATESQGRIHTSTVTVAVLPEAEEVDVQIDPNELRIDVFRSSGPGGQSVNTTDSAVRITHVPTGVVVICQDEKSQHKNRAKAMRVLRSKLLKMKQDQAKQEQDESRRSQVGTGERSERIRTYNFPQSRITDHRINLTTYNLDAVLEGDLDQLIDPLEKNFQAENLKSAVQV